MSEYKYIWLAWLFYFFFVVSDVLLLRLFLLIYHVPLLYPVDFTTDSFILWPCEFVTFKSFAQLSSSPSRKKQHWFQPLSYSLWTLKSPDLQLYFQKGDSISHLIEIIEKRRFLPARPQKQFLPLWVRTRCTNAEIVCSSSTQLDVTLSGRCWQD